jgi:hypothetical protein
MPLAEGTGAVAVEPEHFRKRSDAVPDLPGVAGERRCGLHDRTGVGGVVVPPGLERDTRRRAKRRGVEIVEAQAGLSQRILLATDAGGQPCGIGQPALLLDDVAS